MKQLRNANVLLDQPNILQKRHLFAQLAILLCLSIGRIFFNATAGTSTNSECQVMNANVELEARNIKISFLPLPVWDLPTSKKKNYATYHLKSRACELKGSTMSLTYVWHVL